MEFQSVLSIRTDADIRIASEYTTIAVTEASDDTDTIRCQDSSSAKAGSLSVADDIMLWKTMYVPVARSHKKANGTLPSRCSLAKLNLRKNRIDRKRPRYGIDGKRRPTEGRATPATKSDAILVRRLANVRIPPNTFGGIREDAIMIL